jgi:hypothetical protein
MSESESERMTAALGLDAARPLAPEARARPGIDGTPTFLGDGREWTLAAYVPNLEAVWSELYDAGQVRGKYEWGDVHLAAFRLLATNYDVTPEEGVSLILAAPDPSALVRAVEAALYGPDRPYVSWEDWVIASLLSNGIDPATVPPRRLRGVLATLVGSGRALPHGRVTTAGINGAKRREMLAHADAMRRGEM